MLPDSSQNLKKDVSYINVLTVDTFKSIQTVYRRRFSPQGSYLSSNTSQYLKQGILSSRAHNQSLPAHNQSLLVWFCWLYSVHFSLVVLFVSQRFFQQFHISHCLFLCVFAFEPLHVILNRSIVGNKSFLPHVFKRKLKES